MIVIVCFCINDSDLLNLSKPPVATKGQKGGPIRSRRVLSLCKKFAAFVPTEQKRKEQRQRRAPEPVATTSGHLSVEAEAVDHAVEAVPTEQKRKEQQGAPEPVATTSGHLLVEAEAC